MTHLFVRHSAAPAYRRHGESRCAVSLQRSSRGRCSLAARRLKEVVYTLSNHNQNIMTGLWKDAGYKLTKRVKENWVDNLFLLVPVIGTYQCAPATAPTPQGVAAAPLGDSVAQAAPREPLAIALTTPCCAGLGPRLSAR